MISRLAPEINHRKPEQKHGFLQFSQKLDYGLFLLIELAKKQIGDKKNIQPTKMATNDLEKLEDFDPKKTVIEPVSLRSVAEKNNMSFFFMQKAAFALRKSGIISAGRGKNGGYVLAKPSSQITLKEIIEVLEGPILVMHCLVPQPTPMTAQGLLCSRQPNCNMRHGLNTVNQAIVHIFNQTTLYHLLHPTWKQAE